MNHLEELEMLRDRIYELCDKNNIPHFCLIDLGKDNGKLKSSTAISGKTEFEFIETISRFYCTAHCDISYEDVRVLKKFFDTLNALINVAMKYLSTDAIKIFKNGGDDIEN